MKKNISSINVIKLKMSSISTKASWMYLFQAYIFVSFGRFSNFVKKRCENTEKTKKLLWPKKGIIFWSKNTTPNQSRLPRLNSIVLPLHEIASSIQDITCYIWSEKMQH